MNRWRWAWLLLLAVVILTGCKSKPQPVGSAQLVEPLDAQRLGYVSAWVQDLSAGSQKLSQAEVLDDVLVTVEVPSRLVSVISLSDGAQRWRKVVAEPLDEVFHPARNGNRILLNSENILYQLDAQSGQLVIMNDLVSPVGTGAVVINGPDGALAVYGALTGKVFAMDLASGNARWADKLPGTILVRPASLENQVFVTDSLGGYAMFNAVTGERLWQGGTHDRISAQSAVTPNGVYVASEDQALYALNRANGRDRWIYRATGPLRRGPVLMGNSLYQPLPGNQLVSLDPLNKTELWRMPGDPQPVALLDQKLLVNYGSRLAAIDNQTGKTILEVPVTRPLKTVLRGPANSLILVSNDGHVQRLNPVR
jgi:outer membrane protein assembly factor BamB